ncbi:hypothetical protein BH11MYX1_BH11MYX1_05420 [soil metagenome]
MTCKILSDALALEPATALDDHAAHTAACVSCERHARFIRTLQREPAPIDDVTRARWLARMAPELDAIAARRVRPPRQWLALAAVAFSAAALGWWFGRRPAAPPALAVLDREVLRPYVVAGSTGEAAATALLSGRFASLDVRAGELVRATADGTPRIAVVGPARVSVTRVLPKTLELEASGAVLVDLRADAPRMVVHAGTITVSAQQATFAVATNDRATVVFVDRGEVELGVLRLHAGDWFGPTNARSAALVAALRDHANAISPPGARSGIPAVEGHELAIAGSGAVLGTAPLWARVEPGNVTVVSTGTTERRSTVTVRDNELRHVAAREVETVVAPPTPTAAPPPASRPRAIEAPVTRAVDAPSPAIETASQLYLRAEAALRDHDAQAAESIWRQLLEAFPEAPQADSALYDLATLVRARDRGAARGYLERLLARHPVALREPATYMSCHLDGDANALDDASRCFTAFRAAFPGSAHDDEILAWLAGHAQSVGGCRAAATLAAEYLRRYPNGAFETRAASCRGAQ